MPRDPRIRAKFMLGGFVRQWGPVLGFAAGLTPLGTSFVVLGLMRKSQQQDVGDLIFLGVIFLAAGLAFLTWALVLWLRRVTLVEADEERIYWKAGGREYEQAGEDIATVYRKEIVTQGRVDDASPKNRRGMISLKFRDGQSVVFRRALTNYDRLADAVQVAGARAVGPRKEAELREGRAAFGPVVLTADGVAVGRKQYPWDDLYFSVRFGRLNINRASEGENGRNWSYVMLFTIPDYAVLLTLMERLGKPGNKAQQASSSRRPRAED